MSLLGIDIGTTGTKAIAFSEEGKALANAYMGYNLIFPKPGWVEFDVSDMWEKIFDIIKKVNVSENVRKDPVTALSVSTVGESFTPIDNKDNILYNTIYSTDARSTGELEYIFTKISPEDLYNITGYPPGFKSPLNKILWVKSNLPKIYSKTKKFLFTEDLLFHKLGVTDVKISYSLSSMTLFFDIKNKRWSTKILNEFDINPGLFSEPVPSGAVVGYVKRNIAEWLGFKKKVSVVTGGNDQSCAALGVGAIEGGISSDGMGTVERITTSLDELFMNNAMLNNNFSTQAHVVDGKYVTLAYNMTSGSVIKWYIDILAKEEKKIVSEKKRDIYSYLFSKLTFNPTGMYVLPYFSASGTPFFDPKPKGTIIGLSLATKKEDIFKALIEGLIFEIVFNIELLKESGVKIKELRAVGGGAKSDYWLKLKSAILGKPIKRMDITEAGCLATMILAGKGTGKFSIEEAISNFVGVEREFYPDERIHSKYCKYYKDYKKVYSAISKIWSG